MKNNKLKIYLVIALLLTIGVGYSFLNQNIELDNNVTIKSYEKIDPITIISGERGNLQPGDKIRIGESENFYVISSDNNENGKTILFAKYNLLVGNIIGNNSVTGQISATTTGYGLQSSEARGWYNTDNENRKGTIAFSSTNYWNGKIGTDMDYKGSYSGNPYPYVYDENSNIYPYISGENGYVKKLKDMGAPSTITGRLISYEEATSVKNVKDNNKSIVLDDYQTYWFGSAYNNNNLWYACPGYSNFDNYVYTNDTYYGIRPVIEINTSDI